MEKPGFIVSGELARLIPVIADTRKEQRAVSVLLAVFAAVPNFADVVLGVVGKRIGKRTRVRTYTEIVLKNDSAAPRDRPDGLIEIVNGKNTWNALIEAKIGNALIDQDQLERYLKIARDNSIDAVITISNEFATLPTHHPISISKILTRRVDLLHFSWSAILTEAIILHTGETITDPEQKYLLREFIRFFSHDSAGVVGFTSMPADWKPLISSVVAGGQLTAKSGDVSGIAASWHQEIRDLALQMGQALGCQVKVKLKRSHHDSQETRLKDATDLLCKENVLRDDLDVPDAASEISVIADLKTRTIRVSMTIQAPQDRKGTIARVRWLLRQLKDTDPTNISINLVWPSRAADTVFPLSTLLEDISVVAGSPSGSPPRAFTVTLNTDSSRRFTGRRTFIEDVESAVPDFYERIGQNLKAWVPSPPKLKTDAQKPSSASNSKSDLAVEVKVTQNGTEEAPSREHFSVNVGNTPNELTDIPDFLRRHNKLTSF